MLPIEMGDLEGGMRIRLPNGKLWTERTCVNQLKVFTSLALFGDAEGRDELVGS